MDYNGMPLRLMKCERGSVDWNHFRLISSLGVDLTPCLKSIEITNRLYESLIGIKFPPVWKRKLQELITLTDHEPLKRLDLLQVWGCPIVKLFVPLVLILERSFWRISNELSLLKGRLSLGTLMTLELLTDAHRTDFEEWSVRRFYC